MNTTNLRNHSTTGGFEVVGQPVAAGQVPAGHSLVLVDGNRYLTASQGRLWCGGQELCAIAGELLGVHRVGPFVVVAGTQGAVYLAEQGGALVPADVTAARPSLTLTQQAAAPLTVGVPALAFAEPYSRWQAPLRQPDVTAITAALRAAWTTVTGQARTAGRHYAPCRVRYGVRLWDDSYLWLSDPVELGGNTLAGAASLTAEATTDGGDVTGLEATTLSLPTFTIGIAVGGGVGQQWRAMVKAVDVLATAPATLVQSTAVVDYHVRNTSGGQRLAMLDWAFPVSSLAQVQAELDGSAWQVVASTTDLDALAQGCWQDSGHYPSTPLSAAQARAVDEATAQASTRRLVATLVCNGRLYAADDRGLMTTSLPANPLVVERQCVVTGSAVVGLAAVPRSLYSGGFGRYPVYLFTTEGIFALPLTAQGAYGEPRLLSRELLAAGMRPVEADRDVYFTTARGHLCRLRGSEATVVARGVAMGSMVWDDEHRELWCLDSMGRLWALLDDGHLDRRTLTAAHLCRAEGQALAVEAGGTVRDLTTEQPAVVDVEWLSDAVACAAPPREVEWHVYGDQLRLRLLLLGERGVSCHGFIVGELNVEGRLGAPLRTPVFAPPLRTLRRHITGQAATGTLIIP